MKIILFGAGASIPFFERTLTTKYITDEVCSLNRWERTMGKFWRVTKRHSLSAKKIVQLIKSIRKSIPDCNFEDIAEVLDKMAVYCNEFPAIPITFNNTLKAFKQCGLIRKKSHLHIDIDLPFLFRCVIADIFYEIEQKRNSNYEILINKQKQFIERMKENEKENISIVTLNYDDCIYSSVNGLLKTGYIDNPEKENRQDFSGEIFLKAKYSLSFLHGSMRFFDSHFTNKRIEPPYLRIENVGSLKDDHRSINIDDMSFNTFITTGKSKEQSFSHMPYSLYYHKMATDILIHCNELIIIGYSFNDEHINRLLENFLAKDSIKRMIVVDKYEENVIKGPDTKLLDAIQEICGGVPRNWDNIDELQKINNEGYGYLFPKILFYRKGYECFLEEYTNVMCHFHKCQFQS